jgi:thiamine biosynthesis lipoprotein
MNLVTILLIALIILIGSVLAVILITGAKQEKLAVKEFYAMGTIMQLKVYGKKRDEAIKEAVKRIEDIENKMSVFKDESEISMINKNAGLEPQKVSEDTYYVLNKAKRYCNISDGAFDVTIRPIVGLWKIGSEKPEFPDKNEIEDKLKLVNYKNILLDDEKHTIGLKYKYQAIDVGGIAKGYAADEVKKILIKNGIKSAIINLGGNIVVLGSKTDNKPWKVGIQDPLKSRGEFAGTLSVVNKSVVTSGNYERYFEAEGKRYHHIIDPRTGYPSESEIISVSVISDLSIDGDGLSTGLYIMGLNKAYRLIEALEGMDAVLITSDKKIYITSGIKDNFKLMNINDYKIQYQI